MHQFAFFISSILQIQTHACPLHALRNRPTALTIPHPPGTIPMILFAMRALNVGVILSSSAPPALTALDAVCSLVVVVDGSKVDEPGFFF